MSNNTPVTRKQTVWLQAITFIVLLLATVTDNEWFMTTFTQSGVYAGMGLNIATLILGLMKPLGYDKNNAVEKALREENQADDTYSIKDM